jgi:hypothetical protein
MSSLLNPIPSSLRWEQTTLLFVEMFAGIFQMWLLTSAFEKLRSAITGARSMRTGFILHDPASSKPHDLDDPFFERKIQERIGELIAIAASEKVKSSEGDERS